MVNKKYIREALQFQDLTEEEKQRRGILGRLYGPCASIVDATRNGRLYSDELWEKVFNENEIVKEMLENGGCPMELDHPQGREETCSEKIAAMLPEAPKRDKDGHLICYVDLIDTPCGKIAYQLAKYGFKLGISSRGTGDLVTDANGNESVDPDTYDFTTFDLVLLPAVKDARLSMCESINPQILKFKKALTESYNNASVEDKRIMEDTLNDLNINIATDVPFLADEAPDLLNEDVEEDEDQVEITDVANTVKKLVDEINNYDNDLAVEFKPIVFDDKEYEITQLEFDDSEEGKLVISIGYDSEMSDNIDDQKDKSKGSKDEAEDAADEIADEEAEKKSTKVDNVEFDGMIESLKDAIRQKNLLEKELKNLKNNKTVNDVEVQKLQEDLERYRAAFARTSELATNAKKFEAEVKSLTEQLNVKETKIKKLESIQTNTVQLTESRDANAAKVKTLTEKLHIVKDELTAAENQLNEQAIRYKKQLKERTDTANAYKTKFTEVLDRYVASKASMLGVRPAEIINKLDENYSIDDVDRVYNQLLAEGVTVSRLTGIGNNSRVKINESKPVIKNNPDYGYDIDDDLLELAGLK